MKSGFLQDLSQARTDLVLALLALLHLVLPLFRAGALEDSFITPKIMLVQLVLVGCTAAMLWMAVRGTSAGRGCGYPSVHGFVVLLLVAGGLSALHARSGALALQGTVYLASFCVLYLVHAFGVGSVSGLRLLMRMGVCAAVVTAAWTVSEDVVRPSSIVARLPDWRGYLSAGLGNSGHIAGFVGMMLPAAALGFLCAPAFSVPLFLALGVMGAGLVVTWSVGSTGSTLLSIAVWSVVAACSKLRVEIRWWRCLALLAMAAAVAAFYLLPHPLNPHQPSLLKEAFGSKRWEEGWPTRVVIWETTWHMIHQSPVWGIGIGNFTLEYVRQVVPEMALRPELRPYLGGYTNDAHNEYLQVWAEYGLAGLLALAGLVAAFFAAVAREIRRETDSGNLRLLFAAGAGVTVVLLDALMTFPFRLPAHFAAFMFFLAVPGIVRRVRSAQEVVDGPLGHPGGGARMLAPMCAVLLCVSLVLAVLHGRRVMAEFHLKQARAIASVPQDLGEGNRAPLWSLVEGAFTQGAALMAEGDMAAAHQRFGMARAWGGVELLREAERLLLRSLQWDSRYSNAASRYGSLLLMRGDYGKARDVLTGTLRDLEAHEIHERLGFAHFFAGDRAQAAAHWAICGERRPQHADYYAGLIRQAAK